MGYNGLDLIDRFWGNVNKTDFCWEWTGLKNIGGYGTITVGKRQIVAHRVSFVLAYGKIKKGNLICHRCDNPKCVRPDHLFQGTHSDNAKDAYAKGRLNIKNISLGTRFKKGSKITNNRAVSDDERSKIKEYYLLTKNLKQTRLKFNRSRSFIYKCLIKELK